MFFGGLGWKGYSDMNRQQEVRSVFTRLQIDGRRIDRRLSWNKHYLVIGAVFLPVIVLAIPLSISAPWHKAVSVAPQVDQQDISNRAVQQARQSETPSRAAPTPSTPPTVQPALINTQINDLLNQQ